MRLKLSELLDVEKPLGELLNQSLPIKVAYHLGKLVKKIGSELESFYETRDKLIMRLGSESEPGKGDWSISPDNQEAVIEFKSTIKDLIDVEIELSGFEPMSINDFANEDIKISAVQMAALQSFFAE